MVIIIVTDIKKILKVNRKTPISMKWKEDQNKENEISESENEARRGTESNEIRDVNVSLRTNTGSLSENTTNTKSIKKMSKATCDKKG